MADPGASLKSINCEVTETNQRGCLARHTNASSRAKSSYPTPIYEALLEQDNIHLPQPGRAETGLAVFHVADAMATELVTLNADDTFELASQRIVSMPYSLYPVVENDGTLLGLISDARVRR